MNREELVFGEVLVTGDKVSVLDYLMVFATGISELNASKYLGLINKVDACFDTVAQFGIEQTQYYYFSNCKPEVSKETLQRMYEEKIIDCEAEAVYEIAIQGENGTITEVKIPEDVKLYKIVEYKLKKTQVATVTLAIPNDAYTEDYLDMAIDYSDGADWEDDDWRSPEVDDSEVIGADLTQVEAENGYEFDNDIDDLEED